MQSRARMDWVVLGVLVIIWGSAFAGLKIAVGGIHPFWVSAIRLWVATGTLWIISAMRGEQLPPAGIGRDSPWPAYAMLGLVGFALPFFMFSTAAKSLPSAVNAICNGGSPVFTVVMAHLFLQDERLTPRRLLGVGLGFAGLMALVWPRLSSGASLEAGALGLAIGAAVFYGASNIMARKAPQVSSLTGGLMMCLTGAVFATAGALALSGLPSPPPMGPLLVTVVLGVFSSGLGTVGWVWLIQRRGAVFTSMTVYLLPIWAMVLGIGLMGERPGWSAFAALALILAGVGLTTARPKAAVQAV
ncbi:MAG TPA: DMT family transporter [Caulobacter sp.]|nr:DMT family transporter [Caulobacter sp.]